MSETVISIVMQGTNKKVTFIKFSSLLKWRRY